MCLGALSRSEDNWWKLVPFFHPVSPGAWTQSHQVWQQVPLPAEPSLRSFLYPDRYYSSSLARLLDSLLLPDSLTSSQVLCLPRVTFWPSHLASNSGFVPQSKSNFKCLWTPQCGSGSVCCILQTVKISNINYIIIMFLKNPIFDPRECIVFGI